MKLNQWTEVRHAAHRLARIRRSSLTAIGISLVALFGQTAAGAETYEKKLEDHAAGWLAPGPVLTVRDLRKALFLHRMAVERHSVDQHSQIVDDPDDNMLWRVQWSAFTAAANTLAYSCSFPVEELTDKATEQLFEAPGKARVETWLAGIAAKDLGCQMPVSAHN